MECHKLSIEMNWPEQQTEHAWGIAGFYFIFIPFYLGGWCDRRIFADFWILNKLILAGMALQSLSKKQALPPKFTLHNFAQNWSKLGISGSNCLGIQNCLVVRVQMMGLCHDRHGVYSKIYANRSGMLPYFIHLYEANGKDGRMRLGRKETN